MRVKAPFVCGFFAYDVLVYQLDQQQVLLVLVAIPELTVIQWVRPKYLQMSPLVREQVLIPVYIERDY